jgi:hypothetical protein
MEVQNCINSFTKIKLNWTFVSNNSIILPLIIHCNKISEKKHPEKLMTIEMWRIVTVVYGIANKL